MFLHYAFVLKGEDVSFVPVAFVLSFLFLNSVFFILCGLLLWFSVIFLSLILKFIVSHCRNSILCHTEALEGAFLTQLSQNLLLFSSPPSLSAPFPSRLLPLGLQRATTPRDARAPPFSKRIPDTFSLPTLAMEVVSTPFLG